MRKHAGNAFKKYAVALLSLCIACQPLWGAISETVSSVTVEAAPLTSASAALDGMVRVYLSSLGNPSTLTLTVAGNYSLSTGASLTSGETLTVGFSSTTGAITLTRNGVKTNMGTFFALKRHSSTGTNGIKIAQGRKPDNPYPGDLSFQAVLQSGGGYKLYTVAYIYMESYLYGVLPYEMGSSAPGEALKAQAVAARTYTLRMMNSRASGYYDVVDTTSDQVYNGTPSGYATCAAAVDATKGIVLKNGSAYTATYYSASNGGQTESIYNIWGSSGYSYLGVKDDPFDYANPDSVVKKTTVYANCANASNNSSLMALLKNKAIATLNSAGYSATTSNTTLGTIQSIVAHTPMYASPSKLYTKLDFTLTATTMNSSGASVSATTTVTCGIFTELESLLGMGIQSSKNELWTVGKGTSTFSLEARRYGHGLGMSQRGAMYMGKLGYTYDEILGFYYPDSTRVGCTFTNTILAANSTEVLTTEETSATVENGTGDTCSAVVKLVSSSGSLAIRSSKSTSGTLLGVVENSSPVTVYSNDGTWCLIRFGGITGYVPANALTISGTAPTENTQTVSTVEGFATVTATTYLNLRASGSSSATVLTTAPKGAILTVFSKTSSWAYVQYGATVAYASMDFLSFSSTYSGAVVSSGSTSATVVAAAGSVAYLRDSANTSGTVVTQLTGGITVNVTSDDGSWAYVTYNGLSGYLLSSNLSYASDTSSSGGTSSGGTATEPTAAVSASVGYLHASADETSATIMEIAMGQSVVLISQGTTWCAVRYEGASGYMLTASLSISQTSTGNATTATVVTPSGSLNMRLEASAGSTILTTIPKGASVTVTSKGDVWSAVTYNGFSGYAMSTYLQFADSTTSGGTDTGMASTTATVTTASGSLNLRQLPKAGSTILTTIPRLATVAVNTKGSEWSGVTYAGTTGYAMTAFLTFSTESTTGTADGTTSSATDAGVSPSVSPTVTVTPTSTTSSTDTVTPTPTPTVDPSSTALTAIVSTSSGSLNLRADMLPGSRILTRIPKGTTVTILQKLSTWSQTSYGGYTGYVLNSYLTFPSDSVVTPVTVTAATVMTAAGSLNLRSEPYGNVIAAIPQYATVQVQQRGSTWSYLSYSGLYGYAMTAYLSFAGDDTAADSASVSATATATATVSATATPTASATAATGVTLATVLTPSGSLNLRASASTTAEIITTIPRLASVTVLEIGSTWCKVLYSGFTGYVSATYLSFAESTATATPTGTSSTISPVTGVTAWVYTASGSLNLRVSASTSAAVVTTIPRLSQVTLLSQGATWCQLQYGSLVGYGMTAYLTTTMPSELNTATLSGSNSSEPTASPTPAPTLYLDPTLKTPDQPLYASVTPKDAAAMLPLWEDCTEARSRLMDMLANSQVQVLMRGDTWCQVLYFTQTGYCLTEGLTMIGE